MRIQAAMVLLSLALSSTVSGDDQGAPAKSKAASAAKASDQADTSKQPGQEKLFQQFEEKLSNVKLVGQFTVLGKDDGPLRKEEYTINSVKKMAAGDQWLFMTRIKYGKNDVQVPLPLEVKWAGTTPVITLTDFVVPGLGTFSARVVIYRDKYAGTWSHGKVGGHLFGTIDKLEGGDDSEKANSEKADSEKGDKPDA